MPLRSQVCGGVGAAAEAPAPSAAVLTAPAPDPPMPATGWDARTVIVEVAGCTTSVAGHVALPNGHTPGDGETAGNTASIMGRIMWGPPGQQILHCLLQHRLASIPEETRQDLTPDLHQVPCWEAKDSPCYHMLYAHH